MKKINQKIKKIFQYIYIYIVIINYHNILIINHNNELKNNDFNNKIKNNELKNTIKIYLTKYI